MNFFGKKITVEKNEEAVKLLDEQHIGITQGVILFDYRISTQELKENLDYFLRTKGVNAGKFNSKLLIYHGTELYNEYMENNPDVFYKYSDAIEPPFESLQIADIFQNVDKTLAWGAEWCNDLEDLYWDCAFKYDIPFPDELENLNYSVNEKVVNYIYEVIEHVELGESCEKTNQKMLEYIVSMYSKIQTYKQQFAEKYGS